MRPPSKAMIAIALVIMLLASVLYFSILYIDSLNKGVSVDEGAVILESRVDYALMRVLSPIATLSVNDFSGRIVLENCFPGSQLIGFDGLVERNDTKISFNISAGNIDLSLVAEQNGSFSFAVIGDSQGKNGLLEEAIVKMSDVNFAIHCGDMTPTGGQIEFSQFNDVISNTNFPFFVTPGNHDIRTSGLEIYTSLFGPSQYSFEYGNITFAFLDSSDLNISQSDIDWLSSVFEDAERKIIITHAPSYDPFEGNHTLDNASCDRIRDFAVAENIDYLISGHVHAFNQTKIGNTNFVITGGGGGSLTNGSHHFILMNVTKDSIILEKIDLPLNTSYNGTSLRIVGKTATLNLTLDELLSMTQIGNYSKYQNLYGNYQGYGFYQGVLLRDILELAGGLSQNDTVRITSSDSYFQDFGYLNIYPNASWLSAQGEMIIAIQFNNQSVPDWEEGPRIAFLPEDGIYSNADCELTSYPGQGFSIYQSAGARWSKNVITITVLEG